ncbi:hypothetical protein C0J52_12117 [Blattella germanica]|nr:hypothetical protein C0J52_12117 [Blattella germanica]
MSNKKWAIGGEARRFIYSVIQFCEMEKSQGIQIPITNPTARVRSELLHLVATNKPQPIYSTDTILRENGFIPVRLPPYHPDLNPIELIWNMVKRKVSEKNMSRVPLSELKQNTRDAFSTITKDDWIGAIRHVNQISDDYWTRDGLLEEELDRIIINVDIDSTDESSDDEIQRESATDSSATETADTSATESGDEVTTFMNMGVERL